MPITRNRIAEVGAFQNNCALNCLVHVLLNKSTNLKNIPKTAKDSILAEFNKQHRTSLTTFDEMIADLKGLKTPSEKEKKFGPVLRAIFNAAYVAGKKANILLPKISKKQLEELVKPNTHIADEELNYIVHYLGMNLESYVGNDETRDHRSVECQNPFTLPAPITTLKLWMHSDSSNHYSFEAPTDWGDNKLKEHNAAIKAAPAAKSSSLDGMFGKIDSMMSGMKDSKGVLGSLFGFIGPIIKMFLGFSELFKKEETAEEKELKRLQNDLKIAKLQKDLDATKAPAPTVPPLTEAQQTHKEALEGLQRVLEIAELKRNIANAEAAPQQQHRSRAPAAPQQSTSSSSTGSSSTGRAPALGT